MQDFRGRYQPKADPPLAETTPRSTRFARSGQAREYIRIISNLTDSLLY